MDKSNDWYTHRHPMIGSHTEYDDKHLWNKEQTDNQWLFQIKKLLINMLWWNTIQAEISILMCIE